MLTNVAPRNISSPEKIRQELEASGIDVGFDPFTRHAHEGFWACDVIVDGGGGGFTTQWRICTEECEDSKQLVLRAYEIYDKDGLGADCDVGSTTAHAVWITNGKLCIGRL